MSETVFYTALNKPERKPSPSGYQYENMYQEEISKNGTKELVVVGKTDVIERAQQDLENVQIENILHAVAMGDMSALMQRQATYMDVTNSPKTLMEAQNIVLKAKQEFYNLPLEVRKQFDNSPEMYVSEMGTEAFTQKMSPFISAADKEAAEKAKNEYTSKVAAQAQFEKDVAAAKGVNNE